MLELLIASTLFSDWPRDSRAVTDDFLRDVPKIEMRIKPELVRPLPEPQKKVKPTTKALVA